MRSLDAQFTQKIQQKALKISVYFYNWIFKVYEYKRIDNVFDKGYTKVYIFVLSKYVHMGSARSFVKYV